jgi:hypothetical protein
VKILPPRPKTVFFFFIIQNIILGDVPRIKTPWKSNPILIKQTYSKPLSSPISLPSQQEQLVCLLLLPQITNSFCDVLNNDLTPDTICKAFVKTQEIFFQILSYFIRKIIMDAQWRVLLHPYWREIKYLVKKKSLSLLFTKLLFIFSCEL